jgi:hypothetical protein
MPCETQLYLARYAVEQDRPDAVARVQDLAACLYLQPDCPIDPDLLVALAEQAPEFPGQKETLLLLFDYLRSWLAAKALAQTTQPVAQSVVFEVVSGVAVAVLSALVLRAFTP